MFPPTRVLLFLVLGACLQAAAPVHFGVAFQVNVPHSDLKTDLNDKVGFGSSFQVSIEHGERAFIRPRLDVDYFSVSSYHRSGSNYREKVGLSSVGLGADWLYAFSGNRTKGAYGLAGIGVQQWYQNFNTTDRTGSTTSSWTTDTKKNRVSPWVSLGLGYQINHLVGLELRGVASRYDGPSTGGLQAPFTDTPTSLRTAVITQAALTLRW